MSPEVAQFLGSLLAQQTLQVGAPDFAETAALVNQAIVELSEVLVLAANPDLAEEAARLKFDQPEQTQDTHHKD